MDGFDAFYERLRRDPELPSTSQPSIGDFLAVWEPLIEAGHDVVSVHLAGGISGTCEAARQAHGLLADSAGIGTRISARGQGAWLLDAAVISRARCCRVPRLPWAIDSRRRILVSPTGQTAHRGR